MVKLERKRARGWLPSAKHLLVVFGMLAMLWLYKERLSAVASIQAASYVDTFVATVPKNQAQVEETLNSHLASKKILVAYSGPISMDRTEGKNELYLRNLDFFLKHGVDCRYQDTVIALTEAVEEVYHEQLVRLDQQCQQGTGGEHRVYTLLRNKECHDLATVHTLFYNSTIPTQTYDYFVYINCGMTGPSPNMQPAWVMPFIEPLNDRVKMSGLSVNCFRKNAPHVQSFAYALDRIALQEVLQSDSIFDCRNLVIKDATMFNKIVAKYEKGMSKAVLKAGYGLASIIWPGIVFWENRTNCTLVDRWGEANLKLSFGGRLPHLNETIFFKSSRLLPQEIANVIDFPGEASWHAI
jgi:hypothetical protein